MGKSILIKILEGSRSNMTQFEMPQFPNSYWLDTIKLPSFPRLTESIKVDIGIVGGGITGITAAYLLSKQGFKVALMDAGKILGGTTGHTTAKITAQHGLIYHELMEHFGAEKALLHYQANTEALQFIKDIIQEHEIACDYQSENAYLYTNSEDYIKKLENEKKAYEQLQIDHEVLHEIPLPIPVKLALKVPNQAQFHPLKYLSVLIEQALKNDTEIYEHTTAVDVEYNKHLTVLTRNGKRVTCRYVISATHFPFYDGEGFYPTRMYADRSYVIAIHSQQNYPGGMYINAESPTRSIRSMPTENNNLWIVGGEDHKVGQGKSTIKHYEALQQFADNSFGIDQFMYRWSAQDLITLDKLPYIGPVTKSQETVLVATGYRKWGMTMGTIAAKILSDIISSEKDNPYTDLYTPSRFKAEPSIFQFIKNNADVAKHLVKGKLEYTKPVETLTKDQGTITRINGKRTGIYKDKDNQVYMVDTTCTHLGCEVEWNSGDRTWDCPCHGSRFSYTGEVIEGPAKRPLRQIHQKK